MCRLLLTDFEDVHQLKLSSFREIAQKLRLLNE